MEGSKCDYCLFLTYDRGTDEYYCSFNVDQDDIERLRYSKYDSCPYFRGGDDYTIVRKQGV